MRRSSLRPRRRLAVRWCGRRRWCRRFTESSGHQSTGESRGWADHADPARVRQAATAVVVSRAAVVVVLSTAAVAIVVAVLVRVLEWLA